MPLALKHIRLIFLQFQVKMANLSGPSVGALIALILALIIAIVSMATNHWGDYDLKTPQGVSFQLIKLRDTGDIGGTW